jgi:hypothetical protein
MLVLIIKGNLNMGFGKLNLDFFMKRVVLLRFVKDCYIKVLNAEDLFTGSVFYYKGHTLYAASGTDVKDISSLML